MVKGKREVLAKVLAIVLFIILLFHAFFHIVIYTTLLDNSFIQEDLFSLFEKRGLDIYSILAPLERTVDFSFYIFMAELFVLLLLILFVYTRLIKEKKEVKKTFIDLKSYVGSKSETDIDVLYEILKDKKRLSLSTISKTFSVEEKVALEWADILESGGLGYLTYPAISEPVLVLNENKEKEKIK